MLRVRIGRFRSRRFSSFLVAGLAMALLAGGALHAALRSAPRPATPEGLEVAIASPRGDVTELTSIDVVFSEPMIPLGARRSEKAGAPLEITPSIPGSFTWIGTRALCFIPRGSVPPGTHLTCRVPKETRSLEKKMLAADYVWEIVVDRPRLLRSVPEPEGMIAPDEPLAFLFSQPPASEAAGMVQLESAGSRIELERVTADSTTVASLASGLTIEGDRAAAATLLLRPKRALEPAQTYRIKIPQGLAFAGTDVGLAAPTTFTFATYGAPRIVSLTADTEGIDLGLAGPVDPDTLARYLSTSPPIAKRKIVPYSGTQLRLEGRLRAGRTYTLQLAEGLPSLLGARLGAAEKQTFEIPHLGSNLELVPDHGYLPRAKDVRVRVRATNVDTVQVYGAWVPADSMPARLARRSEGGPSGNLTRLARWNESRLNPDSALAVDLPLERFGKRPARARAIEVRVRARGLFADEGGERAVFRQEGLLQVTDLGLSSFVGADRGLAWVTQLSTGQPAAEVEVRVHRPGTAKPVWTGKTDANGMAWLPGLDTLAGSEPGPIVVEARTKDDGVWLLATHRGMRIQSESENDRVDALTDRPLYRPGEDVHWVAFARRAGRDGIRPSTVGALGYVVRSGYPEKVFERGSLPLEPPGNGTGSFHIPETAAPGSYELVFFASPKAEGEAIGWHSFSVEEFRLPRFEARLSATPELATSGEPVTVEGRFRYLAGGPLASAPVRWTLQRHPDWTSPEGYWDFSFQDDRLRPPSGTTHGGWAVRIGSGEAQLDRDGRIRLPVTPSLAGLGQDQVYVLEMGARDLADRSAYDVVSFRAQRAAVRVGARARNLLGSKERALEFAAAAFDTSDQPIAGVTMRWQIERRDWKSVRIRRIGGVFGYENVPRDTVLARGEAASATEPTILLWKPPGPGSYSLLVQASDAQGRETRARAETYAVGEETAAWYREDRSWLDLKPDRETYARGDTAHVLLPAPAITTEGIALVLDDGIVSAQRLTRVHGSPSLDVPLATATPSAIWLTTVLVGPTAVPEDGGRMRRLPYYAWGQKALSIRADESRVSVAVEAERPTYQPGEEVSVVIRLRDAHDRPVAGTATLAVVDDAIFELYGDDTPDPLGFFYSFRGPGVLYEDVRNALHLPSLGEKGQLTPGGDGGLDSGAGLRRRFLPTVHWEPLVEVDGTGETTVRFPLADDLTRYRMRVVATSGVDRFGYGEGKIEVKKPLMLEWGLPRFAREGDRVVVAAVVRSDGTEPIKVRVRAEAEGARFDGKRERKLTLRPPEGGRVEFTLKDLDTSGVVLRLRAEAEGGRRRGRGRASDRPADPLGS